MEGHPASIVMEALATGASVKLGGFVCALSRGRLRAMMGEPGCEVPVTLDISLAEFIEECESMPDRVINGLASRIREEKGRLV